MDIPDNTFHKYNGVIHKEKKQKKNNNTTVHNDNLRGYNTHQALSTDNFASDDKQIQREANYLKNIHIDDTLERLRAANLVNEGYEAWYCKCMHSLGVAKVSALADIALNKCRVESTPGALFHWLLNKEMNKHADPYMPRFNK